MLKRLLKEKNITYTTSFFVSFPFILPVLKKKHILIVDNRSLIRMHLNLISQ